MSERFCLLLVILFSSATTAFANSPDYSKEAAVIRNMAIKISFSADGEREWHQTFAVHVQSEAAVRQFGVLALSYGAENEKAISLGAGRYRPHTADEVLANQYGDCKDKHTWFVALLKAAGVQAWSALIGSGIKFDPTVPSPAQFNHVITVLPGDGKYTWLNTTAEVAPFG